MKKIAMMILGNILLALGLSVFLLDHNVLLGGISGFSSVLNQILPLSLNLYVYGITILLFLFGYFCFGKEFAMKTLVSSILFPFLFSFFNNTDFLHPMVEDIFFATVIGGFCMGCGVGFILNSDGSTGGFDILALFIHRKTKLPLSYVVNGIDLCIVLLQIPFHTKEEILYGLTAIVISTFVLHKVLLKGKALVQLLIITDSYEKIKESLLKENDIGLTLFTSKHGYTNQPTQVLLCAIPISKLKDVQKTTSEIDSNVFIIMSDVKGIQGYRFS